MRLSRIALSSACALLVASTVLAQQPPRTIIEVNRQKVLPGHAGQYEAARKKHMEWHKQAGDQWTWTVWEVTSGPDTGTYLVTTANHQWADYDSWTAKNGAGDSADSSASIGPHVAGNDRSYWTTRPDLSLWPTSNDLPPMGTLTVYYLKPGMGDQFASAVTKLTGALGKSKWPLNSMWYQLSNGGEPAFAVFVPRKGWADMQAITPSMGDRVKQQLGDAEAEATWKAMFAAVDRSRSEMLELRTDLGYRPAQ